MKRIVVWIALTPALLVTGACNKKLPTKDTCEGVACTMMFAMISVTVENNAGSPVALDSSYTLRTGTGEKIYPNNGSIGEGRYVVLDDGYQKKLVNSSDKFQFIGYKGGKQIVNETYAISADCCHVKRNSGPEKIVVP